MISAIIKWSLDNRALILLATLFTTIIGIYVIKQIPVDAIPDLSDTQVIIQTTYPGQAPQVVEDQVTYPIATTMLSVPGAVTVRGYSYFGTSFVYIIFKDGVDLYWARSRVLEFLNQISGQLPQGATMEIGPDATGVGWIYQYALVDPSNTLDISQLTSLQNWYLQFALQTVPGVSEIATVGGMVKQYQVILDPNQLRAYDLSIDKVREAIQQANQEVGGSVIELAEAEYLIRTTGYLENIKTIENIPLGVNENGTPILLSDVARIQVGPKERRGLAELNGQGEVVGGIVIMRQGENALKTIQLVKNKLKNLEKSLPKGVKIIETYNRSSVISKAIDNLNRKLIEEFIAVSLICLLFLFHFRSSLVIIISLPIGVLVAFIIMYAQGINANIMSLSGIAIAIGAMVDAAIVMVENLHKHLEHFNPDKENRWEVVKRSTMEVGPALFFSLLIITLSFLPIFALQAQEGRLFKPLAYTKTYAMAAAAGLSITLVPVLMGLFVRGRIREEKSNPINRYLQKAYSPLIHWVLNYPKRVLFVIALVVIISVWPAHRLGSEFMPQLDEGDWLYMPTTLPGISIGKAQQLVQQMDRLIKTVPEVKSVFGKVGRAETATDPAPVSMMETVIQFKPKSEWRKGITSHKLKDELMKMLSFPGVSNSWGMPIQTRISMLSTGINTPIGLKIIGPDLKTIQKIGREVETTLASLPETTSVYADRTQGGRYVVIDINRKSAARLGLNISDVQEVVSLAIGGTNVTKTIEGRERYPINIRYPQNARDTIEKIKLLPIVTPSGAHIPLEQVAKVSIQQGPPVIKSEDARPTGWVLINIDGTSVGNYVSEAKKAIERDVKLPPGYELIWSGQYQYMQRAKQRMMLVIPFTLAIILILLYFNFRKFSDVFIIMGTLPLALVGSIWIIYLLQYKLSVAVAVGMIALAGVAVEIGVVMLVYLNKSYHKHKAQVENEGRPLNRTDIKQTIIEGALLRIRPIMMTVSAIIIGLLPIMYGTGTGSNIMRNIAAPMIGGMLSATILTLLVIPATFYLLKARGLE